MMWRIAGGVEKFSKHPSISPTIGINRGAVKEKYGDYRSFMSTTEPISTY
jgi:hypothetical protein